MYICIYVYMCMCVCIYGYMFIYVYICICSQGPEALNYLVSLTSRTLDVINRLFSKRGLTSAKALTSRT